MADAGRVITGSAKGVRLLAPGAVTRPLTDRVKQALFSTLVAELDERWPVAFLDLYAGSGAAGIEALSRGAERAVFVERDERAARIIAENLRRAGVVGGRVVRTDAVRFLERAPAGAARADHGVAGGDGETPARFGAAVVDPPYEDAGMVAALERLGDRRLGWLEPGAVVVAKHFWRDGPPERVGELRTIRARRFGETALTFYRAGDDPPDASEDPAATTEEDGG
jgi:16S rRNA (guanine966-N2)-methyltransferase